MRKDAVVLEVRGKTAVVLASDGRFLRVRNRNYHAGQRIAESEQTPVRLRPLVRRTLIIAACLVLALGSSAVAASKYMVWSYAGLDVGDISVNYTLNFRNEVLRAEGNSEEAEQLMESLEKVPYEPVDSAVERMIDAVEKNQTEEDEKPEITISVASFLGGTERVESRVMEGVDRSIEKNHPEETREERQNEIRLERLEWQDAGRHMEERHLPRNTQEAQPEAPQPPAESESQAQAPEELKEKPEAQQLPAESEPQAQTPEEPKDQPEAQQPPTESESQAQAPEELKEKPEAQQFPVESESQAQAPEELKDQPDGQQAEPPQDSAESSPPDAPAGGNPPEQGGSDGNTGTQPPEPPDQGGSQPVQSQEPPAQPQDQQAQPQEQQAQPQGQPPDSHGPGEPGGGGTPPGQP